MLRVNKTALHETGGVLFYKGEPFSGVAFSMDGEVFLDAFEYQRGFKKEEYSFKYFSITPQTLIVDIDALEPENEHDYESFRCLKAKRYSGIALEFDGDLCTGEILFIRGWTDSQITYFQSGVLESLELIKEGFSQICQWYENGQIRKFEISAKNLFSISLSFSADGTLNSFGIEGDYFGQINNFLPEVKIPLFINHCFIDNLRAGTFLSLSGNSIDDELFIRMLSKGGADQTQHIILQAAITEKSLNLLQKLKHLSRLVILSDSLGIEAAKYFKSLKKDCYVEFKGQEILI